MVAPWISVNDLAVPDSPFAQASVDYATYVLYRLTGEKYPGLMETTETYVAERMAREVPLELSSQAIAVPSRIQYPQRLYLRGTPVHEIHSVSYGGEVLSPDEYALYNKRFLKLRNGASWNYACNPQGITVEYCYGMMPPSAGKLAAATLANEFLILYGENPNTTECRIPERVKSISREGISFDMIDPMEFMDDGKTGIWEIDLFIRTSNPARAKKQPKLFSASDPRRYRR